MSYEKYQIFDKHVCTGRLRLSKYGEQKQKFKMKTRKKYLLRCILYPCLWHYNMCNAGGQTIMEEHIATRKINEYM